MRSHLINMLDALELHRYLGIGTCGDLFRAHRELLHTTSLHRHKQFAAHQESMRNQIRGLTGG